jgi:sugar lactone lactonase YvrE
VETVTDICTVLGEGPIWYGERLYWVDIVGQRIHSYDPAAASTRTLQLDWMVGTVVPRRRGGLAVALENGFALVDERTGQIEPLIDPEADKPGNRFNDGKCDPAGRFWAGTMSKGSETGAGALYMLDADRRVKRQLTGITTSNGLCWSLDHRAFYYIDTPTQRVMAYDYELETGDIENGRPVVLIDPAEGKPDGMTIDEQGNLWIALWDGGAVVCHDPATGKRLAKVEVPASRATACAFGGPQLSDLYITSARVGLSAEELARQPLAGRLFRTQVRVRGIPAYAYAG